MWRGAAESCVSAGGAEGGGILARDVLLQVCVQHVRWGGLLPQVLQRQRKGNVSRTAAAAQVSNYVG